MRIICNLLLWYIRLFINLLIYNMYLKYVNNYLLLLWSSRKVILLLGSVWSTINLNKKTIRLSLTFLNNLCGSLFSISHFETKDFLHIHNNKYLYEENLPSWRRHAISVLKWDRRVYFRPYACSFLSLY